MPRPVKCRKVCHFPNVLEFFPADDTEKKTPIVLTVANDCEAVIKQISQRCKFCSNGTPILKLAVHPF